MTDSAEKDAHVRGADGLDDLSPETRVRYGLSAEIDAPEPFAVEPGWIDAYLVGNLGPTYRLLTYSDGTVRFEHRCDRGERGVIICAPALQIGNGHTLTYGPCMRPGCQGTHDVPTITPSILCPDCGTHGFITSGRWVDA